MNYRKPLGRFWSFYVNIEHPSGFFAFNCKFGNILFGTITSITHVTVARNFNSILFILEPCSQLIFCYDFPSTCIGILLVMVLWKHLVKAKIFLWVVLVKVCYSLLLCPYGGQFEGTKESNVKTIMLGYWTNNYSCFRRLTLVFTINKYINHGTRPIFSVVIFPCWKVNGPFLIQQGNYVHLCCFWIIVRISMGLTQIS